MSAVPFLAAEALRFSYGARPVLRDFALRVDRGEILALFGSNGAGKTTLLRILATLLRPSAGRLTLDGQDLLHGESRREARRRLGLLSHQTMLYERLTALENLVFFAEMYGVPSPRRRAAALLAEVGLSGREEDPVREFSRGMQQRLAIARCLVHDPELLLLDEPFSGLDPAASAWLAGLLSDLARRGKTLIFTSHDLESGLKLCRRAAMLARGGLSLDAPRERVTVADLAAAYPAPEALPSPAGGRG